jgi:hypothetical protein
VVLASAFSAPRVAHACSAPEWDPIAEADVIIAGRVVDMRLAGAPPATGEQVPVWVDFQVDRYLKGSGPRDLSVLDPRSVVFPEKRTADEIARFEGAVFLGDGGSCGALDADPRGTYWVTGLYLQDGVHVLHRLITFSITEAGANEPAVRDALDRIEERLGPGVVPAATGHGVPAQVRPSAPIVVAVGALALVLCARRLVAPPAGSAGDARSRAGREVDRVV